MFELIKDILISIPLSLGNIGAFAIVAIGIVMIYRASKVLNLAHGAMIMFPPYVVWVLTSAGDPRAKINLADQLLGCAIPAFAVGVLVVAITVKHRPRAIRALVGLAAAGAALFGLVAMSDAGMPLPIAFLIGLLAGGGLGYMVERFFVRPLRAQGPTAQTVGTVAALGLVVAVAAKIFGTGAQVAPSVFPNGENDGIRFASSFIRTGEIGLFLLAIIITLGLIVLFQKTDLGLVMRGTAENRRAAALMGIDPDRTTSLTWILGGLLAGFSGILLAGVTNLNPYVLALQALPGFVAALLGGMASVLGAVVGAGIVGLTFATIPVLGPLETLQGAPQLLLAVGAVVAMVTRGQKIVGGDVRSESIAASGKAQPKRGLGGLATAKRPLALIGIALFLVFPFTGIKDSLILNATKGAQYTILAVSLVILIGWVGQISLGHAAIFGIGAYATGWIVGGMGIPFPLSLPLAAIFAAGVSVLLGVVAVRVRGLFLAVATLIFSWMGQEFLFRQEWFIKHASVTASAIGTKGSFPYFDFTSPSTLYFISWAITAVALFAAANLRDSKTGRAFFAVQGSEMAAASLGIDITRYKVTAFAVSGFLAGVAGCLFMTEASSVTPDAFAFEKSLLFVSFAVVGGLRSLGGAVGAGLVFAALNEIQFRVAFLNGYLDVVGAGLLTLVLLAYPGGLAALGSQLAHLLGRSHRLVAALSRIDRAIDAFLLDVTWAWHRVKEMVRQRLEAPALESLLAIAAEVPIAPALSDTMSGVSGARPGSIAAGALAPDRTDRQIVVRSQHVTVRFGGLTAVNDVSMEVREGEIVGLIGPNGAGKTVSFNSIAGLVTPTEGTVSLYGQDVTHTPVHERARLGIARTFQVLQLFPALTVFENLLVATHLHNETGLMSHVTASPSSVAAEGRARTRVREVVDLLGLDEVIDKYPGDLPFGTLRMVEVARALVTDLRFVMLDEAFSGLDDTETEALVASLLKVRALGITILLIEHDVKLVMSVSDYVYVLDRGSLIAEGTPAIVQRDPAVIAAYLGRAPEDATAADDVEVTV